MNTALGKYGKIKTKGEQLAEVIEKLKKYEDKEENVCHGCLYEDGMREHNMCHICSNAYNKQWTAK